MSLYEKVLITKLDDVAIDVNVVFKIARAINVDFFYKIKARMMTFTYNNDDDF